MANLSNSLIIFLRNTWRYATRFPGFVCIMLYYLLRQLLGPAHCRFESFAPSCGPYAIEQLKNKPFLTACKAIIIRLWNCSPWGNSFVRSP